MAVAVVKVMPMHQPYASLVVAGHKRVETRPRKTPAPLLAGRVAVHANKDPRDLYVAAHQPFALFLGTDDVPLGAIVGTVEIMGWREMDAAWCAEVRRKEPNEFAFGDWRPGRFGWLLANPVRFETPILFRAHQGWPDVDDEIIERQLRRNGEAGA